MVRRKRGKAQRGARAGSAASEAASFATSGTEAADEPTQPSDAAAEAAAVEDIAVEDVVVEDVAVDDRAAEELAIEDVGPEPHLVEEVGAEPLGAGEPHVSPEPGAITPSMEPADSSEEPAHDEETPTEPVSAAEVSAVEAEPGPASDEPDLGEDEPDLEKDVREATPQPEQGAAESGEPGPAAYGTGVVSPVAPGEHDTGVPPGHVEGKAAWRRLIRMGQPRTTKANLLGALLAVALGVGFATQVQLTNERGLSELSQSELIRLLDDITARSSRLDQQLRDLQTTRDKLLSGTGNTEEALDQAQRRADTLGILAGTIGAQGPGITVSISDPEHKVSGPVVLDLIQELRDAGAESIDVGGVRVVASSYVGDSGGDLSVDGTKIDRPIIVKAIGDSNTLASAMTIPGGIVETIRQKDANASVKEATSVSITSIHTPTEPVHARPAQ